MDCLFHKEGRPSLIVSFPALARFDQYSFEQGENTLYISLHNSQGSSFRWNQELGFVTILYIDQSKFVIICLCF